MATIEVNGTRLFYVDTGPGSTGETIVFSHGLLWGTEMFEPQIESLRGRYRCVAWDHRGQGQSDPDPDRHCIGMELVWLDAVALIEALGLGAVHFCGLSMGGFVGMRMAARRPDLVRSLMLLETSGDPEPRENIARYRLLSNVVRYVGAWSVRSKVAPIMMGRSILTDASRRTELNRYVAIMTRRTDIWRAVNGVIDRASMEPELARIQRPTVVVVGEEDLATPIGKAEKLVRAIAGATLVRIPRAGHSSTVEEPAAVTAALTAFLSSVALA
ncbi:alpha/beta hydrolase [soil metagenome]